MPIYKTSYQLGGLLERRLGDYNG